jgi:hypothetical protein
MGKDRRRLLSPHLDLHLEVFVPKKMKIAAAGGWGVTEYLQLDWIDDGTDGWMEKASQPQHPLLYVISQYWPTLFEPIMDESAGLTSTTLPREGV